MSGHRFTNNNNYPSWYEDLFWAFDYDSTKGGTRRSVVSATGMLKPPQVIVLEERYGHLAVEDIADMTWRIFGSAAHSAMYFTQKRSMRRMEEAGEAPRVKPVLEERMYAAIVTPDGRLLTISGAPDRICVDGWVRDFKFTSGWTAVFGSREKEYRRQLAIYNFLGFVYGLDVVNKGEICAIYRDWSEKLANQNERFPRRDVGFHEFDLPTPQATAQWLAQKAQVILDAREMADEDLPQCVVGGEDDEVWVHDEKWAYYEGEDRSGATKLYDNKEDADERLAASAVEGSEVIHRPGEWKRCANYCKVAPWCKQYADYCKRVGKMVPQKPPAPVDDEGVRVTGDD